MHSDTDVLIVGAGPTGLTLALLLAARGRTVAVYERWATAYPLPRAAGMSHESVRTFQSVGALEQLRPLLDLGQGTLATSLYAPDGKVLTTMSFPRDGASGFPTMVGFHQPDVDSTLGTLCDASPLVEVHRGWDARAVEQDGAGATVTFDPVDGDLPRDGDPVSARGCFVVGCDGANSSVRSLLGTPLADTGFSARWLVVDTVLREGVEPLAMFGHVVGAERPVTLAPAGRGRQRIELMLVEGDDLATITDDESVWRLLAPWHLTPDRVELSRCAVYTFRGRWAERWRDGCVLLAGDAAHQTPPFLGQGFNSGVRDTIALAWRIDLVLNGTATSALLDSYTTERLPHVRGIVDSSVALGEIMCSTDVGVVEARLRSLADQGEEESRVLPSEWRLGPGCLVQGDPAAGFVSRQARVERDGTVALLDDLTGPGRFVLIGDHLDPLAGLSATARAVWRDLAGIGVSIGPGGYRDVDGSYSRWFDELGAALVLVRPDYQVYGTAADPGGADRLVMLLARQLRMEVTAA